MKITKTRSGMSLVEVVVAMSIFSFMTLAITMAFAASMKFGMRNVKRDNELNTQQTALEKGTAGGLQVNNDSYQTKKQMVFTGLSAPGGTTPPAIGPATGSDAYKGIVEYMAKNTENGDMSDINFQLKTFSSGLLGTTKTIVNKADDEYRFEFSNMSDKQIDVHVNMYNGASAYLGDYTTGYTHNSPIYSLSLPAYDPDEESVKFETAALTGVDSSWSIPSEMSVGLKMAPPAEGTDVPYIVVDVLYNATHQYFTLTRADFNGDTDGVISYMIDDSGNVGVKTS